MTRAAYNVIVFRGFVQISRTESRQGRRSRVGLRMPPARHAPVRPPAASSRAHRATSVRGPRPDSRSPAPARPSGSAPDDGPRQENGGPAPDRISHRTNRHVAGGRPGAGAERTRSGDVRTALRARMHSEYRHRTIKIACHRPHSPRAGGSACRHPLLVRPASEASGHGHAPTREVRISVSRRLSSASSRAGTASGSGSGGAISLTPAAVWRIVGRRWRTSAADPHACELCIV